MAAALFVAFALVALAFPLLLYLAVRSEHDQREAMSREEAERAARRDTRDER